MDLQKYLDAIKKVRGFCQRGMPIVKTEFIRDNQLTPTFFRVMQDLGMIKEEVSTLRNGTIFSWIYKQADNEQDSSIASKATDRIFEINRSAYAKYSTPEWQERAKKRKLEKMKKEAAKTKPVTIFKGLHEQVATVAKTAVKQEEKVVVSAPTEVVMVESEPAHIEQQEINFSPVRETSIETSSKVANTQFSLSGQFSKEEMMKKIMALVDEGNITNFSIEVKYN